MVKCPKCGNRLKEVKRERVLPDPEFEDMSDEELIDFFWEDITGDYDEYGALLVHFECSNCLKKYRWIKK
jgi:hypothetical protein